MAVCNKCGKLIKFIQNSEGKWIPVDPDLVFWREADASLGEPEEDTIVLDDGSTMKGVVSYSTGCYEGYQYHFDTCKARK